MDPSPQTIELDCINALDDLKLQVGIFPLCEFQHTLTKYPLNISVSHCTGPCRGRDRRSDKALALKHLQSGREDKQTGNYTRATLQKHS